MKKILTILALMIATVAVVATGYTLTRPAKAAGDVSNFNGKVSWTGTVTGKGSNTTDVTVTDNGGGLYDICIKKLTVYGRDSEITFTNVPGTAQGEGVVFSTNGQNSTYTVNSAWGDQIAMTVEGKMLGDQLYVFCSGKVFGWSDDPFTITYGEDFEIPAAPAGASYNFNGNIAWKGNVTGRGNNTTDISITEKGNGLYDINIKKITIYSRDTEITFTNVPGTAQGEGVVFSTNGQNSTYTVNSAWGDQVAMTVEGKMLGDQLYLFCSGKVFGWSDDPFTLTYGEDFEMPAGPGAEPTATYTDKVVSTFYGANENTFENSKVDIYETGENKYKFIIRQYQIASYLLGDFTAVDVAGTPNADGSVSYSFNGMAKASNIGAQAGSFGIGEGTEAELNFEGKSKDGKLYINGIFKIAGADATYVFGEEIKDPEPEPTPVVYNDKASSLFMGTSTNFDEASVEVYEAAGTNKFVVKQVKVSSNLIADFTIEGVTGTTNEDGSISYAFEGNAKTTNIGSVAGYLGFTEGGSAAVTLNGKSKDGKLYLTLTFKVNGSDAVYTFGTEIKDPEPGQEEVPGTKVGEDNYAPNGVKFTWNTPIDWNTQKLVAAIDLSGCKGGTTDENILSVGSEIGEWAAAPHLHLYYTSGTKSLNFNFMAKGSTSNIDNRSRYDVTLTDDILVIELSKEKGLVINGTQYLNKYATSTQYADIDAYLAATSDFWALTNIDLGCQQGNPSYATYKYIRVQNLESTPEPAKPVVYTDAAKATFGGSTVDLTDQTVEITATGENLYTVVYKNLTIGTTQIGDFTAENVEGVEDAEGNINYTFEGEATMSNINPTYGTMFTEGQKVAFAMTGSSKDNKLVAKFTATVLGQEAKILYGGYEDAPEPAKPVVYTDAAKATFGGSTVDLTDQTVEITATGENLYTVAYKDLTVGTNRIGDFTAENVEGVEDAEGNINYTFEGQATITNVSEALGGMFSEGEKVAFAMTGSSKDGKLVAKFTATILGSEAKILYGGYEEGGETPDQPGVYTDKFVYTISNYATSKDEFSVTVTDNGDGTYKFELPGVGLYNVVFPAVPGTVNEDGSIIYKGTNLEGTLNEDGDKCVMNFLGKSENGKLCFVAEGQIMEFDGVNKFEFGDQSNLPVIKPDVPGIKVGEDGYQPAGEKFAWNTAIDWNTQKLVASINVAGCTGENEGILSVGDAIDAWPGTHFHLYYTRSNNTLQVNYLDATGNPIRKDVEVTGDELLIEISKTAGITVNGESVNYLNESGELTEDYTVYNALWALTEISVGSQEGNGRSNATYNYVRIQEVPVTVTASESFTDDLTVTEPSTKTKTTEGKKLDINTYSDNTYGVTFYGVEGETAKLGDLTIKGLNISEEDGVKYYNAETTINVNGEDMTAAVTGIKYADGKVWFQVELLTANEDIYFIEYGHKQKEGREFGEGKAYNGQWTTSIPSATFNGTVDVIKQEDGNYALRVHDFQLDGNVVPTFVIPDLVGSEEEGKLYIYQMSNVPVYYEATDGDDAAVVADEKKVTYVEFITVTSEGEDDLSISISYVGYGDGSNDYVTNANFVTVTNGINSINAAAQNGKADIYTINGAKVNAMQKGINIVRMNNKTTKIVKK